MRLWQNTATTVLVQLVNIVYGFVLPPLLVLTYGSEVNGTYAGALQLVGFLAILEAGLSAASIRQLYAPLANHDHSGVRDVLSSVRHYYYRVARGSAITALIGGAIYGLLIHGTMPLLDVLIIVWAVAAGQVLDFTFSSKYFVYFVASAQVAKYQVAQICATLGKLAVVVTFSALGWSVLPMLVAVSMMPLVKATILRLQFRREAFTFADTFALVEIDQRRSVFGHQLLGLVIYNVPVIFVSVMLGVGWTSVYSINSMIFGVFYGFLSIVVSQVFVPRLGRLISTDQVASARQLHAKMSSAISLAAFVVVVSTLTLLPSFLSLYVGSADREYYWPRSAVLFAVWTMCNLLKMSYQSLVTAAGGFADTLYASVVETLSFVAILGITIPWRSIDGVLVALGLSCLLKLILLKVYCHRQIWASSVNVTVLECLLTAVFVVACIVSTSPPMAQSPGSWLVLALGVVAINSALAAVLFVFSHGIVRGSRWLSRLLT